MTGGFQIIEGDALEQLRRLPAESFDSMVTDPPAGISFMGKAWDSFGSRDRGEPKTGGGNETEARGFARNVTWDYGEDARGQFIAAMTAIFAESLRVLKPGAHALVWALPRTSHWTATSLEDAGFEIRDVIVHLFGTGFPKSLDVSKAIDKAARRDYVLAAVALGMEIPGNSLHDWTKAEHSPSDAWWEKFKAALPDDDWHRIEREVVGRRTTGIGAGAGPTPIMGDVENRDITAPATEAARTWEGWGTALKPAAEHWILCRKPLIGTVAANVIEHGTGAINVDGCRVGPPVDTRRAQGIGDKTFPHDDDGWQPDKEMLSGQAGDGRWPANVVLSHAEGCGDECTPECPVRQLDEYGGDLTSGGTPPSRPRDKTRYAYGAFGGQENPDGIGGSQGTASRFFYCAKPSTAERNTGQTDNRHPTVKGAELMQYLCRLVTPPGGTVLDPFMGSGSTGIAALREGFDFVGIEREAEYVELARHRIKGDAPLFNNEVTSGIAGADPN